MNASGTLHNHLEQTVQLLGYRSVEDFALNHAGSQLGKKISYYQSRVDYYEQKYGMDYETFTSNVANPTDNKLNKFGTLEREDDDFEWEDALYFVTSYTQKLRDLGL